MADNANKKKKFSIRKLIYNDKYLIVISILLAILIWVVTSINLSPETTKTITVPVTVDFSDSAAQQLGIKCFGEESIDVDVTISCKKYLAMDITPDDINVYLQTNVVTSSGNYEVPIKVDTDETADFKVTSYYPTTYKAYFDVEDEKSIDVDLSYSTDDFIQDGYTMGQPLLSESTVTVKGPRSYVSQVASVVAAVNITDKLNSTTSMDLVPNAIDVNGNTVDYVTVETGGENLTITIPVLKEMELDVSVNFLGKPSKVNIDDWDITYSVNRVKAGVLEDANITSAVIGNIDFSSLSVGENSFTFDIGTLDGFVILDKIDEITVTVTVPSDYEESTVSVDSNSVKFINIPDGYKAEIISLDNSDVTVIGTEDNLNSITSANINLVVDLSKLDTDNIKVGTNTLDVTTTLSNSDTCWIYGDYSATIKIYKSTN